MLIQRQTHGCRLLVQKVGKAIKPHFKADSLTFAVQVRSAAQCYTLTARHYFPALLPNMAEPRTVAVYTGCAFTVPTRRELTAFDMSWH